MGGGNVSFEVAKMGLKIHCIAKRIEGRLAAGPITGGMGGSGEDPTTCKLGTFFQIPSTLTMPIGNNFQLNGALGETTKLWVLQ